MKLFPVLLTLIIALSVMIALTQIMKEKKGKPVSENFISKYVKKLDNELTIHNASMDAKQLITIQLIIQGVLFAAGWLITNHWWIGVALFLIGFVIPRIYISILKTRSKEKFENNLKIILNHMAALIGAGYSIPQAIEDTANFKQIDKSQRKLFAQMDAMYKMGNSVPEVFKWYADKTGSKDAYSVYSAIKMQSEIGGSEANILKDMADAIQKRIKTRSDIDNTLAETKMTMRVFDIAPFAMLALFFVISPDYINYYFSSPDKFGFLVLIIALLVAGTLIMKVMKKNIQL